MALSTFLLLSKEYFMSIMLDLWMDITYIDESTIKAIQLGLTLGVILATTLTYFPGEPLGIEYGTSTDNKEDKDAEMIQKKETMKRLLSSNKDDVRKLEKLLGISEKEILEECSKNLEDDNDTALLSVRQTLNLIVYITIFIIFILFVNQEYDNAATAWFVHYFPREAATLHIIQQQQQ